MTQITRRNFVLGASALALTPMVPRLVTAGQSGLDWSAVRGNENDFFRAPVLLTGTNEAMLVDGSFTFPAGEALVEQIKASGKELSTIYLSCADPDYYFSLKPVKAAFPEAKVIAASETINAINANVQRKIDTWGPQLGEYGPQSLDDIVFAESHDDPVLQLEGNRIDIVTSAKMHDRRYLWVPSLEAVIGGMYGFDGLHVWTADTPGTEERNAWISELDSVIERKPKIVVAGHAATGTNNGITSLKFTRDYLMAYEEEVSKAGDSAELIAAMKSLHPDLGLLPALEIGAKVAMGEMDWG